MDRGAGEGKDAVGREYTHAVELGEMGMERARESFDGGWYSASEAEEVGHDDAEGGQDEYENDAEAEEVGQEDEEPG